MFCLQDTNLGDLFFDVLFFSSRKFEVESRKFVEIPVPVYFYSFHSRELRDLYIIYLNPTQIKSTFMDSIKNNLWKRYRAHVMVYLL